MVRYGRYITYTLLLGAMLVRAIGLEAQSDNPYHHNGNAYQENCHCFTLTPDEFNQTGSVWNINKINLNEPFDFKFSVFLGCRDGDGADGIAFVLQPISTSIGTFGQGIGYQGVSPSIGVLIDTWQNFDDNDPGFDHISIHRNGVVNHSDMDNVTTAVPALQSGGNLEDCEWHSFRITWDPATFTLNTEIDGVFRTGVTLDIVRDIFSGDPMVFWGFTSATGGARNHQRVCTSLDASFKLPDGQSTCFPQVLQFEDSSTSFGTIEKWFWDFGDGTTSELQTPPPHNYAKPGNYEVSLTILGNDGCLSDPFAKTIVMGSEPTAAFNYSPNPVCEGVPITFLDESDVEFGTINKWNWQIGTQHYSDEQPPPMALGGTTRVQFSVETLEGCVSEPIIRSLTSFPVPSADFDVGAICVTDPATFTASNTGSIDIIRWTWNYGDGRTRSVSNPVHDYTYTKGGEYAVRLTGYSVNGCPSPLVEKTLNVYETNAFAGNDTILATNQPIQLNASGGQFYQWTPATGLTADDIPNPVVALKHDQQFVLTAYTELGCATTDTLNIKVYKGPELYVPSAFSPNNDGKNDRFKFIAVGMRSVDLFQVYNRYGQLIYSSSKIMEGWDGRMSGKDLPAGTYVWLIRGVDFNGLEHFKKGTVTLIR